MRFCNAEDPVHLDEPGNRRAPSTSDAPCVELPADDGRASPRRAHPVAVGCVFEAARPRLATLPDEQYAALLDEL